MNSTKMFRNTALFAALWTTATATAATTTAQDRGATIFADVAFRGWSHRVLVDDADLGDNQIGIDRASSVRVDRGCRVRLYESEGFRGPYVELRGDHRDLGHTEMGNDRARSVRVRCGWNRNWGDDDGDRGRGDRDDRRDDDRRDDDRRDDDRRDDDRRDDGRRHDADDRGERWGSPPYGGRPRGKGVTIYRDSGFRGVHEVVHGDIANLGRTQIGNDALSSIELSRGCSARVWRDSDFRGDYIDLREDVANLGGTGLGNDRASSIQVRCRPWRGPRSGDGGVTLFRDGEFRGASETFTSDVRDLRRSRIGNDSASSIEVDPGCRAVLYENVDFEGEGIELWYDVDYLRDTPLGNDRASSLRVDCRR